MITAYKNGKIALINKISESGQEFTDEVFFLDDGYIKSKIEKLKTKYNSINKDIELLVKYDKRDEYSRNKIRHLLDENKEVKFQMAFLASNNFKNLDNAIGLLEDTDTDFKLCLYALKYYNEGDSKMAYEHFYEYFKDKDRLLEHFLINKVYGELLFSIKQYDISAKVLRKAAERRPEEKQIHIMLKEIYKLTGQGIEEKIQNNILDLLEGSL